MATTTNFGWETPDDTDLVKDGAAAIRTLGQSIDTSMADLEGGTTGQVLSKASNTDMDFTWVTTDDTNAIQNAIVDAKGDLIAATAADTPARLAVGTNGQLLTADSTAATGLKWVTPTASASGLTLISATSCSSVSSQSITAFSSTYTNYRIIYSGNGTADQSLHMRMRSGSTDSSADYYYYANRYFSSNATNSAAVAGGVEGFEVGQTFNASTGMIEVYRPFEAERTSVHAIGQNFSTSATRSISVWSSGVHNVSTSYDGFTLRFLAGAFTGTIFVYGYQKS